MNNKKFLQLTSAWLIVLSILSTIIGVVILVFSILNAPLWFKLFILSYLLVDLGFKLSVKARKTQLKEIKQDLGL